jgi:hypothetical protein
MSPTVGSACYQLDYPAICSLKGHGSSSAAAEAIVGVILHDIPVSHPRPKIRRAIAMRYPVVTDPASAIDRVVSGRLGPGQRLAAEAIKACSRLMCRGNPVTPVRWTPAHLGVEGNEMADLYVKGSSGERALRLRQTTSFVLMTRLATEARSDGTSSWIASHIRRRHGYRPPRGGGLRKDLRHERKALAGRYYQLLSGHAATGPSQQSA